MPVTPLTTESRAIADRFREFPNREGSVQFLHKLIYEDSVTLAALRAETAAIVDVDPDIVQGVANAEWAAGNCGEVGGNTGMWYRAAQGAGEIDAACDAVEASQRLIGSAEAIQLGPDPAVQIVAADLPIDLQDGDQVKVTAGWPSLDGQWFVVRVLDAALGQFQILGVDTTGETGTGAGATVLARPAPP